jgi:glycosyltransferase involved in cell wall biosynthesis
LSRYLEAFEQVVVLARVKTGEAGQREERADGPGVTFFPLPDYRGPWGYLRHLAQLRRRVGEAVRQCDAYILRVPGLIGRLAWKEIRRLKRPYALEVVGDPWEALGPRTWPDPLRPLYRRVGARDLRSMCRDACAIRYVSGAVLPKRYPPHHDAFTTIFSDLDLGGAFVVGESLAARLRRASEVKAGVRPLRIGFLGSFAPMYKGPDVLLEAAAHCIEKGLLVDVSFAGEGRHRREMQVLAGKLGLERNTRFLGQLPFGKAVYDFLDGVDLFAMPSRTEGLPRALIEAMARGCPCVASNVGGIPELLLPEDMVPPNDPRALAAKIMDVARDPERMARMARRNWEKAQEYRPEILDAKRREFYQAVRRITEEHAKRTGG